MTAIDQASICNHLLAALTPEDFAWLAPMLERVDLADEETLFASGEAIHAVHFVESGVVSMMTLFEDGSHVEVGAVGREGVVGLPLLLGDDSSPNEASVQFAGTAFRLGAVAFRLALERSEHLRLVLLRYTLAYQGLIAQTAACNARHVIGQRLARWLLLAHDRMDDDDLPLTHDFLATMLGVRRAGITGAAGALRDSGLIRCDRGHITVLDRAGLEAAACECHRASHNEIERLAGPVAARLRGAAAESGAVPRPLPC